MEGERKERGRGEEKERKKKRGEEKEKEMKKRRKKRKERGVEKDKKGNKSTFASYICHDGSACSCGGDFLLTDTFFPNENPSTDLSEQPAPHLPCPALPTGTGAHLKSLFVTGCLSRANGFSVTSLGGSSSPLLCREPDPMRKVPPGSCTMLLPSSASAARDKFSTRLSVRHERGAVLGCPSVPG